MQLGEGWRAAVADEALRRAYPEPAFDDSGWEEVAVPGRWADHAAFASTDGPVLYRTAFRAPAPTPGRRAWLRFDGLCYQADVWLDGAYVGDTEGYFFPHCFEVTDALGAAEDHVLAIELACSNPADPSDRRNITGALQPGPNPGGIWEPVVVDETGPVAITRFRAVCTEATEATATVTVTATLDASERVVALVRTTLCGVAHVEEMVLAAGPNSRSWTISIESPALWWPHSLGEPILSDLEVVVAVGAEDAVSDGRSLPIGLRKVELRSWCLSVNGERLFVKGLTVEPGDDGVEVVRSAVGAGADLVRMRGHVAPRALYDAADRAGVLVWQDLPLQGTYARGIRKQATRQAAAAVDLLGHHASIALWCAHDDPYGHDGDSDLGRRVLAQQVPSWNATVLDGSVKRALERADPSRPVIPHSGVLPHAGSGGTDTHLRIGRDVADATELGRLAGRVPRLVRFVGHLGATAGSVDEAGRAVEALRRIKYRPTGGVVVASGLDVADAMAPVIVVADVPAATYAPGDPIDLDVHVVSDLRTGLDDMVVTALVAWEGGSETWTWTGDVPPDSCVLVGRLRMRAPFTRGAFVVDLDLVHHGAKATNRYLSEIREG